MFSYLTWLAVSISTKGHFLLTYVTGCKQSPTAIQDSINVSVAHSSQGAVGSDRRRKPSASSGFFYFFIFYVFFFWMGRVRHGDRHRLTLAHRSDAFVCFIITHIGYSIFFRWLTLNIDGLRLKSFIYVVKSREKCKWTNTQQKNKNEIK